MSGEHQDEPTIVIMNTLTVEEIAAKAGVSLDEAKRRDDMMHGNWRSDLELTGPNGVTMLAAYGENWKPDPNDPL